MTTTDRPLHPTRTRLNLLRGVADGDVHQQPDGRSRDDFGGWVAVRMAELERAGWVTLGAGVAGQVRAWVLTEAGRAVLEAGRG